MKVLKLSMQQSPSCSSSSDQIERRDAIQGHNNAYKEEEQQQQQQQQQQQHGFIYYFQRNNTGQKELMLANVKTMLEQETNVYKCTNVFGENKPTTTLIHTIKQQQPTKKRRSVDITCREKICEWTYRVIDYFHVDRECAYHTMSYLDRFLMSYSMDRFTYKLAATTTLLLALKVHHPHQITLTNVVSELSRGEFDIHDVNRMELIILRTLSWSLHPPTPMNYVIRLLALYPFVIKRRNNRMKSTATANNNNTNTNTNTTTNAVHDYDDQDDTEEYQMLEKVQAFSIFFVELSLFDYDSVTKTQSSIALAAIWNAAEGLGLFRSLPSSSPSTSSSSSSSSPSSPSLLHHRYFCTFISSLCKICQVDFKSDEFQTTKRVLWELYEKSDEYNIQQKQQLSKNDKNVSSFTRDNITSSSWEQAPPSSSSNISTSTSASSSSSYKSIVDQSTRSNIHTERLHHSKVMLLKSSPRSVFTKNEI